MKNLNLNLFLVIGFLGLFVAWGITHWTVKNIQSQLSASLVQLKRGRNESTLENFTQCLAQKGIKFYGSSGEVDTEKQKMIFGKAVDSLPYVECLEPKSKQVSFECQLRAIKIFPTWEFPNGQRKTGFLSLEKLKKLSGCKL